MFRVSFKVLSLAKLYPLAISRGVTSGSDNLYVFAEEGGHVGIGELAPATGSDWTAERGRAQLEEFVGGVGFLLHPPAPSSLTSQSAEGDGRSLHPPAPSSLTSQSAEGDGRSLHPPAPSSLTSQSAEGDARTSLPPVGPGLGSFPPPQNEPRAEGGATPSPTPPSETSHSEGGAYRPAISEVWRQMRDAGIDPPAMAALDVALWDLFAKQCGMPLHRVFGLPNRCVPTSVTIGINPPEVIRERVPKILGQTGGKFLKVKLGSPEGIEADKANFEAAREAAAPFGVGLRVDANGGWSLSDAKAMLRWLAARGAEYVEQPLVEGAEDQLPELFASRALPIFVDESCRFSSDVAKVADRVDGVNLKLMKCGGLTEALRIVATARAHGLKTMIGCMSESSIAIAAGAAIGSLFDHIDLDSQLNLNPDPAEGSPMVDGVVFCREVPGHGAGLKSEFA